MNSINTILAKYNKGETFKYLFFWGHQRSKDGSITKSCFSQWWLDEFKVNDLIYKSAEHYMMAEKARLFDPSKITDVLLSKTPAEAKKIGRLIENFDNKIWNSKRVEIVVEANYHKFSQNINLKKFLLGTGDRVLVEASPVDNIWGIGMSAQDQGILNPNNWKGDNLLGFSLMKVRDLLAQ